MAFTAEQQRIHTLFSVNVFDRVVRAIENALAANKAVVSLPATASNGEPVVHRDNLQMMAIRGMYMAEAHAFLLALSTAQRDEIAKKYRHWQNMGSSGPQPGGTDA